MKIAIVSTQYPSDKNHYAHTFVHRRSKFFLQKNHDVTVFVPNRVVTTYNYDQVNVELGPARFLAKKLDHFDVVYFHLLNLYPQPWKNGKYIYEKVIKECIPCVFYIHGSEVQSISKSRNFDHKINLKQLARLVYKDYFFMPQMRVLFRQLKNIGCKFITPSNWMYQEASIQLGLKFKANIIPNGIDTGLFKPSNIERNNRLLCIRPLNSKKYAVDIAIETMKYLPEEFELDIYGMGEKINEYIDLIRSYHLENRVKINERFIENKDMPELINRYSYFLIPTRMDAQGVTMCEALSCGKIVCSSNNTAIPEFITDGITGILSNSPQETANKILSMDDNMFRSMTVNARNAALSIDLNITLSQELNVLNEAINESNA